MQQKLSSVKLVGWRILSGLGLLFALGCSQASGQSPIAANDPPKVPVTAQTATPLSSPDPGKYDWLQFNGDPQHSGNDTLEQSLTVENVANLKTLFHVTIPGQADTAPVYLSGVTTPQGTLDLVFLTTTDGHILAVNGATGAVVWQHQYGPGDCNINRAQKIWQCYTTASPAVDPNRQFVYSYGVDGKVHKYQVGDGTEITSGGWPQVSTLKNFDEKGSASLAIATDSKGNTYLYVATSGYPGDVGDYQGHLTTINLATGAQQVFNSLCSDQVVHFAETPDQPDCGKTQSAIWGRPGVIYNPANDRIYMSTGNGDFNPDQGNWGDTLFALNADGTGKDGKPLDSFTPANYDMLNTSDLDLGSSSPALLPVPANSKVKNLALQTGKDSVLRLLDLDDLRGQGGPGHTGGEVTESIPVPQGDMVLTQPAVWVNPADNSTWVFIGNLSGISGLKLVFDSGGKPSLQPVWKAAGGGSSPILVNGILFFAGSALIRAMNPTTGQVLWQDTQITGIHWESPIVANGVLYIPDQDNHLTAYSLQ